MREHKRLFALRRLRRLRTGRGRHVADDDPLFEERELDIAAGADEKSTLASEASR